MAKDCKHYDTGPFVGPTIMFCEPVNNDRYARFPNVLTCGDVWGRGRESPPSIVLPKDTNAGP